MFLPTGKDGETSFQEWFSPCRDEVASPGTLELLFFVFFLWETLRVNEPHPTAGSTSLPCLHQEVYAKGENT